MILFIHIPQRIKMNANQTIIARNTFNVLAETFDDGVAQEILVLTYNITLKDLKEGEWFHSHRANVAETTFSNILSRFGGDTHQYLNDTEINGWLK